MEEPEEQRRTFHHLVKEPEKVSDTLKCPVCMEVFDEPVFCGGRPCQHVFCTECIYQALERNEQCPVCREPMLAEDLYPHQVIRSLLDEVTVICERNCGWSGRRDAVGTHLAVCPIIQMEKAQQELASQNQRFAGADRQLRESDERIAELEALVREKDRLVVETGSELVKRQLQISELEANLEKAIRQLENSRRQVAERDAQIARLMAPSGGVEGWPSGSQIGRPQDSAPPSTPLHKGPEDTIEAAILKLDGSGGMTPIAALAEMDAWLDPEGYRHTESNVEPTPRHREFESCEDAFDVDM